MMQTAHPASEDLSAAFAALRRAVLHGTATGDDAHSFHDLYAGRVLHEPHAGAGSLAVAFADSLNGLQRPLDAVGRAFLGSDAFAGCGGEGQPCVEEAFGRFLIGIGADAARTTLDMLRSVLLVRAVTARPVFTLPVELRHVEDALVARVDCVVVALLHVDSPDACLVTGPLPAALARAVTGEGPATAAQAAALRARGFPVPCTVQRARSPDARR